MKSRDVTISDDLLEIKSNTSNSFYILREQTFWNFNAGAGLIVLFALFSIFILFFLFILEILALEINILPVALSFVITAASGIIIFIGSHAVDKVVASINNSI
jgi:hypothetical protein